MFRGKYETRWETSAEAERSREDFVIDCRYLFQLPNVCSKSSFNNTGGDGGSKERRHGDFLEYRRNAFNCLSAKWYLVEWVRRSATPPSPSDCKVHIRLTIGLSNCGGESVAEKFRDV